MIWPVVVAVLIYCAYLTGVIVGIRLHNRAASRPNAGPSVLYDWEKNHDL